MKLQQVRKYRELMAFQVANRLAKIDKRVDAGLYSKMENGVCLPTPPMMAELCNIFDAAVTDLYDPEEIDLLGVGAAQKDKPKFAPVISQKDVRKGCVRKIQFRLDQWACNLLASEILAKAGYRSQTDFFYDCLRRLEREAREASK